MTVLPSLPASGSTAWYPWATGVHTLASEVDTGIVGRSNGQSSLLLGIPGLSSPALANFTSFNTTISPRTVDVLLFMQAMGSEPIWYSTYATWADKLNATIMSTFSPATTLNSFTSGSQDTYLAGEAATVAAYGKPVIIRMCHEFNGNWGAYGFGQETAAQFVAAWQYVVNYFRSHGATNALWFWCPNAWSNSTPTTITNPVSNGWYPGDAYVDIVGLDGYSYDSAPFTPTAIFSSDYTTLTSMTMRPFWFGEFGVGHTGATAVGTKAQWYDAFFDMVRDTMPRCIGVNQWQRTDATGSDFTTNSSGSDTAAQTEFVKRVNAPPMVPGPTTVPNAVASGTVAVSSVRAASTATYSQASMGTDDGTSTAQTISVSSFTTIGCNTVVSDTGGNFNTSTFIYTVPSTGLYFCQATVRPLGVSTAYNLGIGIHTSNADNFSFMWTERLAGTAGANRHTILYDRIALFNAGDQLRLFVYLDAAGSLGINCAQITVLRLA